MGKLGLFGALFIDFYTYITFDHHLINILRQWSRAMPTTEERLGVVETKVAHLNEKVDDIKEDVKETKQSIASNHLAMMKKLDDMELKYEQNRDIFYDKLDRRKEEQDKAQSELKKKINDLQDFKMKWVYIISGVAIAIGWVAAHGDAVITMLK